MKQLQPIVRVVAHTMFLAVPPELLDGIKDDDGHELGYSDALAFIHRVPEQDVGSPMARLIEVAGRNCYDSFGRGRTSEEYHRHIIEVINGSVTEHASITFYLDKISRGLSHELVRHRIGHAISQRSTRYVDESQSDLIWHPLIFDALKWLDTQADSDRRKASTLAESIDMLQSYAQATYRDIEMFVRNYLLSRGVDGTNARKQARGAARGALPNALSTAVVWTANVRALRNCLEQRAWESADGEIRVLFDAIFEAAIQFCPEYFSDYERVECKDGIGYGLKTAHRKI